MDVIANASRYRQFTRCTTAHIIRRIAPCTRYSTVPTDTAHNGLIASYTIKVGAAIIETPRSAFLLIVTPSATRNMPSTHISSAVFGIFLSGFFIGSP